MTSQGERDYGRGRAGNLFLTSASGDVTIVEVMGRTSDATDRRDPETRRWMKVRALATRAKVGVAAAALGSAALLAANNYINEENRHQNTIELEESRARIAFEAKKDEVVCSEVARRAYEFGRTRPEQAQAELDEDPELDFIQSDIEVFSVVSAFEGG